MCKIKDRSELAGIVNGMPALVNTPEKKGVQNFLGVQKGVQNLDTLGYLESSQEIEIKNIKNSQSIASSVVSGVLSRESKVRPVGIEPTTLDLGNRCSIP